MLMEDFYSNGNLRIHKLKSVNENAAIPHTETPFFGHRYTLKSHNFDPYSPDNSAIIRYLNSSGFSSHGNSPLSSVENIMVPRTRSTPVFGNPVKVEEDVIVMDETPLSRVRPSIVSESIFYKTEICRAWEESGNCRYRTKCQFAHGQEELRPTRYIYKNKPEAQLCKSFSSTGFCTYGSKCRFLHQPMPLITAIAGMSQLEASKIAESISISMPTDFQNQQDMHIISNSRNLLGTVRDWLPQDDDIEPLLPSSSWGNEAMQTREDVDTYMNVFLYGSASGKKERPPAFAKISLDDEDGE